MLPPSAGTPAPRRRGATLLELMVALTLATVGVLGLAGASALIAREMDDGRRHAHAAAVARARLERLLSTPCPSLASGSVDAQGVRETWTVHATAGAARSLAASVAYRAHGRPASLTLGGVAPCDR